MVTCRASWLRTVRLGAALGYTCRVTSQESHCKSRIAIPLGQTPSQRPAASGHIVRGLTWSRPSPCSARFARSRSRSSSLGEKSRAVAAAWSLRGAPSRASTSWPLPAAWAPSTRRHPPSCSSMRASRTSCCSAASPGASTPGSGRETLWWASAWSASRRTWTSSRSQSLTSRRFPPTRGWCAWLRRNWRRGRSSAWTTCASPARTRALLSTARLRRTRRATCAAPSRRATSSARRPMCCARCAAAMPRTARRWRAWRRPRWRRVPACRSLRSAPSATCAASRTRSWTAARRTSWRRHALPRT